MLLQPKRKKMRWKKGDTLVTDASKPFFVVSGAIQLRFYLFSVSSISHWNKQGQNSVILFYSCGLAYSNIIAQVAKLQEYHLQPPSIWLYSSFLLSSVIVPLLGQKDFYPKMSACLSQGQSPSLLSSVLVGGNPFWHQGTVICIISGDAERQNQCFSMLACRSMHFLLKVHIYSV